MADIAVCSFIWVGWVMDASLQKGSQEFCGTFLVGRGRPEEQEKHAKNKHYYTYLFYAPYAFLLGQHAQYFAVS